MMPLDGWPRVIDPEMTLGVLPSVLEGGALTLVFLVRPASAETVQPAYETVQPSISAIR